MNLQRHKSNVVLLVRRLTMSRKRVLLPPAFKSKKKLCTEVESSQSDSAWNENGSSDSTDAPSDTKAAMCFIKNLFPVEKFEGRLPPIILTHQLYSIINSRTKVDKELGDLRQSGEIRLFKLGSQTEDCYCVIFTEDFVEHVKKFTSDVNVNNIVIEKFLTTVLGKCQDVSVNQTTMFQDFHFTDDEITHLVKGGLLTVRDVGSWWMSFPQAGIFMKCFIRGRKAVLTIIRKCKYKEINQKDLEGRKLPKIARLGMLYHIHDLIGADLVECVGTSTGRMLRLKDC